MVMAGRAWHRKRMPTPSSSADHESIEHARGRVRAEFARRLEQGHNEASSIHLVAIDLQLSLSDCAEAVGHPDLVQHSDIAWRLEEPDTSGQAPGAETDEPPDWREDRVGSALAGRNPTVMSRLPGGFAVIGDVQFLPGYSVLITDRPGVDRLSDLPREERARFLSSMDLLGEAVEQVCAARDAAFRRVNLEILGNADALLHAHVWPRYDWEPAELITRPVWLHPRENWSDPALRLSTEHDGLRAELAAALDSLSSA